MRTLVLLTCLAIAAPACATAGGYGLTLLDGLARVDLTGEELPANDAIALGRRQGCTPRGARLRLENGYLLAEPCVSRWAGESKAARCAGERKQRCAEACGRITAVRAERAFVARRPWVRTPRACENAIIPSPPYDVRLANGTYGIWRPMPVEIVKEIRAADTTGAPPPAACAPCEAHDHKSSSPPYRRVYRGHALFIERTGGV